MLSAATATATAMTVGIAPPPDKPHSAVVDANVDLAAAITLLPNHDQVPDLTGGLGATIYSGNQAIADQLIRAVVNGISLTAFAQAAGLDPQSLVKKLLVDIPANLLPDILATIALDLPILDRLLPAVGLGDQQLLTKVLDLLGVDGIAHNTLTGLLAVFGLDLADPFSLSNLLGDRLGVNVVIAGPEFAALKVLGLNLGRVPSLPDSVANEINGTPYLKIGLNGVLDVFDVRLIPTVGFGIGAFSVALAYQQVLEQLKFQPGGSEYDGVNPLLGSLTILPMILLDNPARPDGGAFARFGALANLLGINTVNPHTQLTGSGGPLGDFTPFGLHLGGANVLPILIDVTYEYQPLSDLASWPNPFTLLNNLAAGLAPTYVQRGSSLGGLAEQLAPQLEQATADVADGKPLALNLYLTLHSETLPLLEPLYLTSDALNIVGLSPLAAIPMRLANALAPALTILTNIGYANVVQNPDGTYTRDFSTAGTETPFMSFPDIDYGRLLSDVVTALVGGFQKEFFSGHPSPNRPNALAILLHALTGDSGGGLLGTGMITPGGGTSTTPNPLGGLGDLLNSVLGGLVGNVFGALDSPQAVQQTQALTASSVPSSSARMVSLASTGPTGPTGPTDENAAAATETKTDLTDGTAAAGDTPDDAGQPKADDETPPKHARPDDGSQPAAGAIGDDATPSKHGPKLNVVRDGANASSPQDAKPDKKTGGGETGKKDAEPTGAADAPAGGGTSTGAGASGNAA
jgi:hypothetical protein